MKKLPIFTFLLSFYGSAISKEPATIKEQLNEQVVKMIVLDIKCQELNRSASETLRVADSIYQSKIRR